VGTTPAAGPTPGRQAAGVTDDLIPPVGGNPNIDDLKTDLDVALRGRALRTVTSGITVDAVAIPCRRHVGVDGGEGRGEAGCRSQCSSSSTRFDLESGEVRCAVVERRTSSMER